MKAIGVYAESECSVTNTNTYSLPLGLGSIFTFCRMIMGDSLETRILDGSMMSHEEQKMALEKFRPEVTFVSPTIGNYRNSIEIGEMAHSLGSLVFFGGVHATALRESIMGNRPFVHGVGLYDGEITSFLILNRLKEAGILKTDCFKGIPNLTYRDSGGEIHPPESINIPSLSSLPDIDYSLFDLNRFFKQTESRGFGKAVSYYAGKGCAKRGKIKLKSRYSFEEYMGMVKSMDICSFCGRNELGLRNMEQDRETKIVRGLHDEYGVTGFFNVQDTVNLTNTEPVGIKDSWFRLFIGLESITPKNIIRLKRRYGPNLIFQVGIESASPGMRMAYGKSAANRNEIFSKTELCLENEIQMHDSFILGGRGDTEESIRETADVAARLSYYPNVTWILISPQLVLPGSPDYNALLQMPRMAARYAHEDTIPIPQINEHFLQTFAPELTRAKVLRTIRETFGKIKEEGRADLVLDVKGVVGEEEEYVGPTRPYKKE